MKHLLVLQIVVLSTVACGGAPKDVSNSAVSKKQLSIVSSNTKINTQNILKAHNQARKVEGVSGLAWSDSLAEYAQEWANSLKSNNNCALEHRPSSGAFKQKYGENLFYLGPVKWSNGKTTPQKLSEKEVVKKWVGEKANYDPSSNKCNAGSVCSHYTQVVWGKSTQFGCAVAACSNQSQVVVCNYNPAGNIAGQRPF